MELARTVVLLLISPLNFFFICIILSSLCYWLKKVKSATITFAIGIAVLFLASQASIANLLLYPLEFHSRYSEYKVAPDNVYDLIYVPACYYTTIGNIPEISRFHECSLQRLAEALRLYQVHPDSKIIVTGGNFLGDKSLYFAEKAKLLLVDWGVPETSVIAINEGLNTQSEVFAIRQAIIGENLVVVSSATHGIRLIQMLSPLCKKLFFSPVDFHSPGIVEFRLLLPSTHAIQSTQRAIYEYLAIFKYQFLSDKLN